MAAIMNLCNFYEYFIIDYLKNFLDSTYFHINVATVHAMFTIPPCTFFLTAVVFAISTQGEYAYNRKFFLCQSVS